MLAATEPGVRKISAMVSTQLMKSTLIENVFGYHAHLDPCPILIVQPKDNAAVEFSKERITPLIGATPALRGLVGSSKTRSATQTLQYKAFPGGFLGIVGAGSPDNLARRPIRVLMFDEVDKYLPLSEGDPLAIAEERQAQFDSNSLNIAVCSPTVTGESKIEARYQQSDQRRASIACPECGHRQFPDFFRHILWVKGAGDDSHKPETARFYCESCGVGWTEGQRLRALQSIRWHQSRAFECCGERQEPLVAYAAAWPVDGGGAIGAVWDWWAGPRWAVYRARCRHCGEWPVSNRHAGFQASKLYSPLNSDQPSVLAEKWLAAIVDEDSKQVFYNTQLALTYRRNTGKQIDPDSLLARREAWAAEVPDGVALLTAGIDTQDYRVEVEIVGWGRDEESWSIATEVIDGELSHPKVQAALDALLMRKWSRADGRPFVVHAACIDTGGHHTDAAYEFAKARLGRFVWGIKGESARTGQRNPVWPTKRPSSRSKKTYRPIVIGVNAAKDTVLLSYLPRTEPGPGYMHFPADRDAGWFAQLAGSERLKVEQKGGQKYRVWEAISGRANEALDCRVYAYAALHGLMHFGLKLNREAERVGAVGVGSSDPAPATDAPAEPPPPPPTGPSVRTVAPNKKPSLGALLARGGGA